MNHSWKDATEQQRNLAGTHQNSSRIPSNTMEAPEAVTDRTGEVVGIDLDPDEPSDATEHTSRELSFHIVVNCAWT